MNKSTNFFRTVQKFMVNHSPEILTGLGIAGMIGATVLAVKATPKALKKIEETKEELNVDKLTVGETIKSTWKCYIPAAGTCVASTACLIGASSVHTKRNAALAAAYKLSETAMTEYREKVVETIGEKKEKEVHEAIAKEKIAKNPVINDEVIATPKGTTLCLDACSERWFRSDRGEIEKAINRLNRKMNLESYVSLNDFYEEINLYPSKIGDVVGWKADWGLIEPRFSSCLANDGSTPCLVIDFYNPPKYGYDK